ncbi:TPA: glycerophosphodiester phosphodiesterase [Desulfurococcaceae archaeon]|nr:glycerophosphodiester phosphodiesterase [Desulfurococcaceae archaeon]
MRPMIVGHQGARFVVRGNTLQAFRYALENGADAVECDVWRLRDGSLAVHHDREVQIGNKKYDIKSFTLGQLKRYLPYVPSLKEVLSLVVEGYKKRLFVELKDPSPLAAEALDKALEGWEMVTVISFYAPQLKRLKYPSKGLLFTVRPLTLRGLVEGLELEWVAPRRDMADRELVGEAKELGLKVLTWLHNRPKEVREALELGVEAFATDRPDLARAWLEKALREGG